MSDYMNMMEIAESFKDDHDSSLKFLENSKASSLEDEMAIATTIAVLNRYDEMVTNAADIVEMMVTMLSLTAPSVEIADYVMSFHGRNDTSEYLMEMILTMINLKMDGTL